MCRIALITKKPSPSSARLRSAIRTLNLTVLISTRASATLAATATSNPFSFRTGGRVSRMLSSSSTKRMRAEGIHGNSNVSRISVRYHAGGVALLFRLTLPSHLLNGAPDATLDGGLLLACEGFHLGHG